MSRPHHKLVILRVCDFFDLFGSQHTQPLSIRPPRFSCCHPERARIPYFAAHTATTYVVSPERDHVRLREPLPTGSPGKPRNLQFSVCKAWRDFPLKVSKMLKMLKVLK